mmetsp:Transcript_5443/g.14202  ORF Transcript_5443/g.14202 Transcript_5443/m.14202 type:complete len:271 (-) Transcript_5443:61-873(-)
MAECVFFFFLGAGEGVVSMTSTRLESADCRFFKHPLLSIGLNSPGSSASPTFPESGWFLAERRDGPSGDTTARALRGALKATTAVAFGGELGAFPADEEATDFTSASGDAVVGVDTRVGVEAGSAIDGAGVEEGGGIVDGADCTAGVEAGSGAVVEVGSGAGEVAGGVAGVESGGGAGEEAGGGESSAGMRSGRGSTGMAGASIPAASLFLIGSSPPVATRFFAPKFASSMTSSAIAWYCRSASVAIRTTDRVTLKRRCDGQQFPMTVDA